MQKKITYLDLYMLICRSAVYLHHHMHRGPEVIKLFFMLKSNKYEISTAYKIAFKLQGWQKGSQY